MRRVRICTGCALGFVSWMRIILSPFVSTKEIRSRCGSREPTSASSSSSSSFPIAPDPSIPTSSRRAFRYAERTNRTATKALPSAAAARTLRDHRHHRHHRHYRRRLHSARKINYGRRGELFAGFVALSSLVTFNLLAGINLILLYSPRRPDPFAPNLSGLNHFFLPPSSPPSTLRFRAREDQDIPLSSRASSALHLLDSIT